MTPLRVLVAENAGERRLADAIAAESSFAVAAVAASGADAVALTRRLRPDAVVMSAALGGSDALAATREIMSLEPTPIIFALDGSDAASDRTRSGARAAGALATVTLPALIDAVRTFAPVKLVRRSERSLGRARGTRPHAGRAASLIAIAASTGGPAALHRIFGMLSHALPAPMIVTQHISAGFSEAMVGWLDDAGPTRVKIAEDGEELRDGTAYFPADDRHLTVTDLGAIALSAAAPLGGHRPSASVMFASAAEHFGAATCAVILTGMGHDGVAGLADVRRTGGRVLAQDAATCVVFGMPKAAIDAGVVDAVLPLDSIAAHVMRAVAR